MNILEVFITSLKLGLTSFGGPIAHLSFFREEFVQKKKWMSEESYADLVALCQFLPGPASSQVGMAVGYFRSGVLGAFLAWIGFTLPSALLLIAFGLGLATIDLAAHQHWLHGLKVVAVAVVAQAVLGMGKKLCPDKERLTLAIFSSAIVFFLNSAIIQVLVLALAGLMGSYFLKTQSTLPNESLGKGSRKLGIVFLSLFFLLLALLPVLKSFYPVQSLMLFDSFYRAGSLVFGGGHVVLPLLQAEVVPTGWVSKDLFLAGYGLANAVPGPLFTFSAYLGAVSSVGPNGWIGAFICLVAVFLPSFFLVIGILPFWEKIRVVPKIRQAMLGLNAAVVGILFAAFCHPVWISAIFSLKDFGLAIVGFLLLEFVKLPSWAVVLMTVAVSFFIY